VKTNIGHLELAAGIAGVIKVLLQLKHKKLVKSLHCETINPYIQLQESPFYIVQEAKPWEALITSHGEALPRRAGISSFGFGGVNAHIVIEEYIPKERKAMVSMTPQSPAIIILSAKNEVRLKERAEQLLSYIQTEKPGNEKLIDIAYTLQMGRDAMEERLGFAVGSIGEMEQQLRSFITGTDNAGNLYHGQIKRSKDALAVFTADEDLQKAIDSWITKGKYAKLLDLWVKGLVFDWNRLYSEIKPQRISLPTYPFAQDRYWVPETKSKVISTSADPSDGERFNDQFYEQLIDEVMNDAISIDSAVKKIS